MDDEGLATYKKQAYYSKQDPSILQAAIDFFYGGNYQESATDDEAKPSLRSVVFHARVYDAAECLEAPDLETLAADKFERACECIWSGDEFVELAQAIYHGSTLHGRSFFDDDSELHRRFLKVAKAHAAELLCSEPACA